MTIKQLTELFDRPLTHSGIRRTDSNRYVAWFYLEDSTYFFKAELERGDPPSWDISFDFIDEKPESADTDPWGEEALNDIEYLDSVGGSTEMTGTGNSVKVISTIVNIFTQFINKEKPQAVQFTAKTQHRSRVLLYRRLAKIAARSLGYTEKEINSDNVKITWYLKKSARNNAIKPVLAEDQYSIDRLKKYVNDPTYVFSSDTLNRLIDDFPFDGGVVYRGMNFLDQKSYENFVKDMQDGKLKTATLTSWTRYRDTAHQFAITRPTYHFNNMLAAAEQARMDIGDYMIGYRGLILKTRVQPNIALDVNKSGVAAEDEVILPPGTYTVEIESEEIPYKYRFTDNQKINDQILSFDKNNFSESQKNLLLFVLKNTRPEDLSAKTRKHIFNLLYDSNRNSKLAYNISKESSFSAFDHRNTVRISTGFNPILLHYINIFDQSDRNKLIKDCDTVLKNTIALLNSKMQEDQIDISLDRVELSPLMTIIIDHASPSVAQKYVNYIKKLVSAKYNELNSSVAQLNKITDRNQKQEEISNFRKKMQNVMNFAKHV